MPDTPYSWFRGCFQWLPWHCLVEKGISTGWHPWVQDFALILRTVLLDCLDQASRVTPSFASAWQAHRKALSEADGRSVTDCDGVTLVGKTGLPSSLNCLEVRCVRSAFNQLRDGEATGNLAACSELCLSSSSGDMMLGHVAGRDPCLLSRQTAGEAWREATLDKTFSSYTVRLM